MQKRPPKPLKIPSNPRFVKPPNMRKATLDALSKLSRITPKHEHRNDFLQEINQEKNDRGAAILVVTNVENALQSCLEGRLLADDVFYQNLFGINSPLGSFDNKITMAYALEIIGPQTRENLDIIRPIRNAFAHSKIPIHFETKEVDDACKLNK